MKIQKNLIAKFEEYFQIWHNNIFLTGTNIENSINVTISKL